MLYNKYSDYLKSRYGQKVYKLPVNLPISCPNRDGTIGVGGCYFCSDLGTGFESLSAQKTVEEQLLSNMSYIGKRYGAKLFIAYFQNYTNTHMPFKLFKSAMQDACIEHIVEIVVSTRPDCISVEYLQFLKDLSIDKEISISIELGLQTTNDETLKRINRGHNVSQFVDAVRLIQTFEFPICAHLILNLPWDDEDEVLKMAELMNQLSIEQIKLHALYIAHNTRFEEMYLKGEFTICTKEEYVKRAVLFLEHLNPDAIMQRLIGRVPETDAVFCNWSTSWWKIHDEIEALLRHRGTYQGASYTTGQKAEK